MGNREYNALRVMVGDVAPTYIDSSVAVQAGPFDLMIVPEAATVTAIVTWKNKSTITTEIFISGSYPGKFTNVTVTAGNALFIELPLGED